MTYTYIGPFKIDAKMGFHNIFYAQKLRQSPKIIFFNKDFCCFLEKKHIEQIIRKKYPIKSPANYFKAFLSPNVPSF